MQEESTRQMYEFWKTVTIGGYIVGGVLTGGALFGGGAASGAGALVLAHGIKELSHNPKV